MSPQLDPERIGPVDIAIIGFVGDDFKGEIAPALMDLEAAGTVRIIDLAFVRKDADGNAEFIEVEDAEVAAAFAELDDPEADLLNDIDLMGIAESLERATAAMVVVWENTWAASLATAIRGAGGLLLSYDRVPHDAVVEAVMAIQASSGGN